jgi:hypothetical protein
MRMSASDAILLCCAGMIVLMVITLGLVPSVIRPPKEQMVVWPPR